MPDRTDRLADRAVSFGPFRLVPAERVLLEAGKPVRLGSRAFDILVALIEQAGELVAKDALIARAWPDTFVEDGNLRVHVAALRKVLGDGQAGRRFIANVPGRGYRFVAPVSISEEAAIELAPAVRPADGLPAPLARIVGRADLVEQIAEGLPDRRFVTLVGPGGIGKTTVAVAVAQALSVSYVDGVRFVDLAPISDPGQVPRALASELGVSIAADRPIAALAAFLKGRQILVVLDSCEHVLLAAAALAEGILASSPGVNVLATSREPLRALGERVQRLPPLGMPPASAEVTAAAALACPAIQLFVERAAASVDGFELSDADAPMVADICRRLDGIALAIELAAARVDALGIAGLAARLDDRMRLLTTGRRSALPRHRTLRATLDWSHDYLSDQERAILRRLAVFVGTFTLEAAVAVAGAAVGSDAEVVDRLANLVAKSLVGADVEGATARYRLLDTTRAYALEKLTESGERDETARRHADHFRRELEQASSRPVERSPHLAADIANVRAALEWSFSPTGDAALATTLAAAAVDLWFDLSLFQDCREWSARAIARIGPSAGTPCEMVLQTAFGFAATVTIGMTVEADAALTRAFELAERHGDTRHRLRTILARRFFCLRAGDLRSALRLAREYHAIAASASDPGVKTLADWLLGATHYFRGEHAEAGTRLQAALDDFPDAAGQLEMMRSGSVHRLNVACYRASNLWLLGFPDQAARSMDAGFAESPTGFHVPSICVAHGLAIRVSLRRGDLAAAEGSIAAMLDIAEKHSLPPYHANGQCATGTLAMLRGDPAAGVERLEAGIARMRDASYRLIQLQYLPDLALALALSGHVERALQTIDEALVRMDECAIGGVFPESLRIKGEIVLMRAGPVADEAEDLFRRAIDDARRRHALSWELRAATSLARLQADQGRRVEARDGLASVYDRFTEGFGTADLVAARTLLAVLS